MTKTPEEMAEEYADTIWDESELAPEERADERHVAVGKHGTRIGFLAGYETAKTEMNSLEKPDGSSSSNSSNNSNSWISVKDRLPDKSPMVLAMCTDGYELAYYGMYGGGWTNTLGTEHLNVTHWQPLPAPPKEEG